MNTKIAVVVLGFVFGLAGCRTAPESHVVQVTQPQPVLQHILEVDAARLPAATNDSDAIHRMVDLVSQYFAHVGRLVSQAAEAGAAEAGAVDVYAELPSPGYRLAAHVESRPDDFILVRLTVELDGKQTERAPFFALDAFENAFRGLDSLHPARGESMPQSRFERLQREASALKANDADPALTLDEYSRSPRQISSAGGDTPYYSPSRGPSKVEPTGTH